jgi:hypothetical protein
MNELKRGKHTGNGWYVLVLVLVVVVVVEVVETRYTNCVLRDAFYSGSETHDCL